MNKSIDYIGLGRRVQRWRKRKKLSQEKLAEMTNISTSFLGHIERGTRKASIKTMVHIAVALGVTPNDLLRDSMPLAATMTTTNTVNKSDAILKTLTDYLNRVNSDADGNYDFDEIDEL